MPLLAEELMDLTIEELINDYGAEFVANEHWWGFEFGLKVGGLYIYSSPADYGYEDDLILTPKDFEDFNLG